MKKILLTILISLIAELQYDLLGNNLLIENINVSYHDSNNEYARIGFDLSWENSWRDNENWDAIWLVLKFNHDDAGWTHGLLNYVDGSGDGHVVPDQLDIRTSADQIGVFVFRSEVGSGDISSAEIQLRWNYGENGESNISNIEIVVVGVEMVYIPEGSFWLGDGDDQYIQGHFENAGIPGDPLEITSEAGLILGGVAPGNLGNHDGAGMCNQGTNFYVDPDYQLVSIDDFNITNTQTLPDQFPKGYQAFYCMKYELTQGQYSDFLNLLTIDQSMARYATTNLSDFGGSASTRYNIAGTYQNFSSSTPYLPSNLLSYQDGAAFADWVGLRPMTELEYEKACRGFALPVSGEFAWGTNEIQNGTYTILNEEGDNEYLGGNYSLVEGNAWYSETRTGLLSPVRVGAFAANPANTGRVPSGASYFGVFEMSGNCFERTVTVGRPEGRSFEGSHGNGVLTAEGFADNSDWPGSGVNGVTGIVGCGYRGGAFNFPLLAGGSNVSTLRTSSRASATAFYNLRYNESSIRLVRTAD